MPYNMHRGTEKYGDAKTAGCFILTFIVLIVLTIIFFFLVI